MKLEIKDMLVENSKEAFGINTPSPRYSFTFKCKNDCIKNAEYTITITDAFKNVVWQSEKLSAEKCFNIRHGGDGLKPDCRYTYKITLNAEGQRETKTVTAEKQFSTGFFGECKSSAQWISAKCDSPLFRKTFFIKKKIKYATAYIASRGFYELYINGKKATERVLCCSPSPNEAVANAYDITRFLSADNNTVGLWLAPSYKSGDFAESDWCYRGSVRAWCTVSLVFYDGTKEDVVSDGSWIWHNSPVKKSSIYGGETFASELYDPDWCSPYSDTASWKKAKEYKDVIPVQRLTVPVKELETQKCRHFEVRENEVTFCDFGKNTTGYLRIKVTGEPGTKVIITHSENVTENGTLNCFTNGAAQNTDTFILKGYDIEIYAPHFTYRCFRYAEIRMDGVAQLISAEKVTIGADIGSRSSFLCDDVMLQRMYDNAIGSLKANMLNFYSDCAVRDSRVPSPEAAATSQQLAFFAFDSHCFFCEWLKNIAGSKTVLSSSEPAVLSEIVLLAYLLYVHFGDFEPAEKYYSSIKSVLERLQKAYAETGFKGTRGDWCQPKANPKNLLEKCSSLSGFTGCLIAAYTFKIAANIAALLSENDDEASFSESSVFFQKQLYKKYFRKNPDIENGKFAGFCGGEQTANLAVLSLNIARKDDEKLIYNELKRHIVQKDAFRIATGTFGTQFLISTLSRDDEGFEFLQRMLHRTDYPGFVQQILDYDATCLCEQWFGLQGVMSCCHSSFAGMFADYYRIFAGIKNNGNQYKTITIDPILPQSVAKLHCTLSSVRGDIEVYMRRLGSEIQLDAVIPYGCTASIRLPNKKTAVVTGGEYIFEELLKIAE